MRYGRIALLVPVIFISLGISFVFAQSPPTKPQSPGEIAAASKLLAEKNEICRNQAKAQKLHFLKRRSFIRECINKGLE